MPLVFRKGKHGLEYRSEAPHLVAKRVAEGWCTSKADALAPKPAQPPVSVAAADAPALDVTSDDVSDDNAPPTRDEMERKAVELNIKVDKRWSDKTLAERIDEALKG
jgi:hypothetical protein